MLQETGIKPTSARINGNLGSVFFIILLSGLFLNLRHCDAWRSQRDLIDAAAAAAPYEPPPSTNFSLTSTISLATSNISNASLDDTPPPSTIISPISTSNSSLDDTVPTPTYNTSLESLTSSIFISLASNNSNLSSTISNLTIPNDTPTSNSSLEAPSSIFSLASNSSSLSSTMTNLTSPNDTPTSNSSSLVAPTTSNVSLASPTSSTSNSSLVAPTTSISNSSLAAPPTNLSLAAEIVFNRTDGLCLTLVIPQGNYRCTEFMVPTNDGFLLGVQRMSNNDVAPTKGTIFLMHGFLVGGDVWVLNEPSEGLGFILADAGYDVWIGNSRTTRFSFGHLTFQRNDHEFWDWSVDELANQDLPAMLTFVSQTVGDRMHYIGYSQGSQQAFAAFSQGHLLSMVDKVVMLAPVAFVDHGSAPVEIGLFEFHIDQILELANVHEFSTQTRTGSQMVELICRNNVQCFESWVFLFAGDNCCLNLTKRSLLDKYETQATSVKNLVHLAQQGRSSTFSKFDYGLFGNLKHYGSSMPPRYPLENVPSDNLLLINGLQDALADPTDVSKLVANLGGIVNTHTHPTFGHLDFILADSASTQVYPQILGFLGAVF